jgi:hypothetical protein
MEEAKKKLAKGDIKIMGWVNHELAKRYTDSVSSRVDIKTTIGSIPSLQIKPVDIRFNGNQAYIK